MKYFAIAFAILIAGCAAATNPKPNTSLWTHADLSAACDAGNQLGCIIDNGIAQICSGQTVQNLPIRFTQLEQFVESQGCVPLGYGSSVVASPTPTPTSVAK